MYGFIYMTVNIVNNKKYIGKCEYNRLNGWENYLGSGKILKQAIKRYGKSNFIRNILAEAKDKEELDKLEIYYIELYDACNNDDFYNIAVGGTGGNTRIKYTQEELEEYIERTKNCGKRNGMYGKKHTLETKRKNGDKTIERFKNEEFRKKHSDAVKRSMAKVDKEKLKMENRTKNKVIKCLICGKEEKVYTSQQQYCSDCKKKYSRWTLSQLKKI